ncbi:hypothetical protein HY492_00665 [Candidatus Woesearchaeota archaeon]|nr:hypothetical protein [Candidatus Woesearchaeota archaeon]
MKRGQASLFLLVILLALIVFLYVRELPAPTAQDGFPHVDVPQVGSLPPLPQPGASTTVVETSSLTPTSSSEFITRTFSWDYDNREWSLKLHFDPAGIDVYKERSRYRDYDLFASDPYDDLLITDLADKLRDLAREKKLSSGELPYFVASFVQSLPYTSDDVTTPFDEYPRFPYETLVDDGGDCEDTSILAAALLQELGYGVVLLELPKHMAVGVECTEDIKGSYVTFEGKRYCYLETTGENWPIGQIPEEYEGASMQVIPIEKRPALNINFTAVYRYTRVDLYADVLVVVKNVGSKTARNTKIYTALQADEDTVWDSFTSDPFTLEPEDSFTYNFTNLHMPSGETFRIFTQATADDALPDDATSQWITWD